ncbi:MAG: efflux RND transporter periplasmic adaptor subunit [Gammaproteobacteria bacterium]|nr:efflux RND transporter periplasmic adaptor subunit [Gammaproteobacteria bacterium]
MGANVAIARRSGARIGLTALLLGVLASGCKPHGTAQAQGAEGGGAPQMPPPAVSAAEVVSKEVTEWDEFTGRLEAVDSVNIQPRVAGYIESVNYKEGAEVKKGDVLFVIDQRPFKAELARADAELARARAQAQLADAQAARARQLLATKMISQEEADERYAARTQAAADIRAAEANVDVARLDMEYTAIRSPIDGRAGRAFVTPGNLVSGGEMVPNATLLTTVVSLDPMYVYFDADEQTYLRYGDMARSGKRPSSREVANPVQIGLADEEGFPHAGRMDFVDNVVDPATGTIRARAVLDNKERIFTPGLFARVRLIGSGKFQAILIDDKAILTDQDRKYVYVLGPNNVAERRDIKPGRIVDGLRIVTAGLNVGDKVIIHGVQKVFFPGMPVAPQMIKMGDPPPPAAMDGPPPAVGGEGGKEPAAAPAGKGEPASEGANAAGPGA